MTPQRIWRSPKAGYTLAEMLIVITIMIMLVAIALPSVKRVMEDSGVREASRQLNAYFAMAKSRAVQTGRPCGILMICDNPLGYQDPSPPTFAWPPKQITKMYLAEVPPPYSGTTTVSRAKVVTVAGQLLFTPVDASDNPDLTESLYLAALIEPGEIFQVRFGFKGEWYKCIRGNPNYSSLPAPYGAVIDPSRFYFLGGSGTVPPSIGKPFQVVRMPRRIGNPLEMPPGTCIDLVYSGVGPSGQGFYPPAPASKPGLAPLQSLAVMFSPEGNIDSMFVNNYSDDPQTTVHFLIGKLDKVNPPFPPSGSPSTHATGMFMYDPETSNLADPLSLWVSVARNSGLVVTSENLPPTIDTNSLSATNMILNPGTPQQRTLVPTDAIAQATYLTFCRQLATNREQVGGR